MTKTTRIAAALALALASAFGTGCAVDNAPCQDADCVAVDAEDYAPATDLEVTDVRSTVHAELEQNTQLKPIPGRIDALQAWTVRMADAKVDTCDLRFARYFAESDTDIDIFGCEDSIIAEFIDSGVTAEAYDGDYAPVDGRPEATALVELSVEETKWMLLGLDIQNDVPLTVEQEGMLAEADDAELHRVDRVHAEAVQVIEPRFHPNNM